MPQEKTRKSELKAVPPSASMLDDASEAVDLCPKCGGAGLEIIEGKGARICSCRKLRTQSGKFASVRLPKRYDGFHFQKYVPQTPSQKAAFNFAQNLVHEYPAVDRGLLLMGNVGVGKTHLAVSMLKGLTERGFTCLFYEFGSLLKEIQDSYNPHTQTSELSVLSPVLNAEVLVLDELGGSKPTEWVKDTMAHVINTRYNDRRLTIFTTNFLDERQNAREEVLEDRIGTRLRSRLFEMCKTVVILGDDYRKNFDRAAAARNQ